MWHKTRNTVWNFFKLYFHGILLWFLHHQTAETPPENWSGFVSRTRDIENVKGQSSVWWDRALPGRHLLKCALWTQNLVSCFALWKTKWEVMLDLWVKLLWSPIRKRHIRCYRQFQMKHIVFGCHLHINFTIDLVYTKEPNCIFVYFV